MKVCVVGLGYIGLPTASLLAAKGFNVYGVDINIDHVESINRGQITIVEPDLDVLVRAAVQSGKLTASIEPQAADVFIIAVPTPFKDGHAPDLSYLERAVMVIAPQLTTGNLILLESTIPIGTTEKVGGLIQSIRADLKLPQFKPWLSSRTNSVEQEGNIYLAHCPERVLPGQILKELIDNDRVVGGLDRASGLKAKWFYEKFINGKVFITDARTAELCKLSENAYRDVNIAFANELSMVCEEFTINVWELIELTNRHPRVNILQPGPGVGGHCIAVDPWFIVHSSPDARLIRTAREVNDAKPERVLSKIRQKASRFIRPIIGCLGLAFKADVGDMRESPALRIVSQLVEENVGNVLVVEPHADELPIALAGENVKLVDLETAVIKADIIVLLVDHREFQEIDREVLKEKVVIDTRGLWR
ncbi:MAG: nucleotide sugar dehydrogenase [Firmicutes bacterium]|nr:nucleotide sugar dehydrogenase [Bacillota bacterium]